MELVIEELDFTNLTLEQTKKLEKISIEIRDEYNSIIERAGKQHEKDKFWWFTTIASRDVYQSSLYYNCCYIALIKYYLDKGYSIKKIIFGNKVLAKVISQYFDKNGIDTFVLFKSNTINRIKSLVKPFYVILRLFQKWLVSRIYKGNYSFKRDESLMIVDVFFEDFAVYDGEYRDRYYGNIFNQFVKEGYYYFPSVIFSLKKFRKNFAALVKNKKTKVIFEEHFLSFKEYMLSFLFAYKNFVRKYKDISFCEVQIDKILNYESKTEFFNYSSLNAFLRYKAIENLKKTDINIKLIINWFENQLIDKACSLGFHDFFKESKFIAFKGFAGDCPNYVHHTPTQYELENYTVSEIIAVCGKGYCDKIKVFSNKFKPVIVPALRSLEVYKKNIYSTAKKKGILMSFSSLNKVNENISDIVADVKQRYKFKELDEVYVKIHPDLKFTKNEYVKILNDAGITTKVVEGNYFNIVGNYGLVVTTASGTALETIAKGIPVVVIGNMKGLTNNYIPADISNKIWEMCYTAEELADKIKYFLSIDETKQKEFDKISDQIRKKYFEPFSKEAVNRLIKL